MGIDFRDARYRRFVTLGKRTVKDGECMVVWDRKGAARVVVGPRLERLWCSQIRFLDRFTASPEQYLCVRHKSGRVEHVRGPALLYENPVEHDGVEVKDAIVLKTEAELVVLYREVAVGVAAPRDDDDDDRADDDRAGGALAKGAARAASAAVATRPLGDGVRVARLVVRGPTAFVPEVGDRVHEHRWSRARAREAAVGGGAPDDAEPAALTPGVAPSGADGTFRVLSTAPRAMTVDVPLPDAVARLTIRYALREVDALLASGCADPIADLYGALEADLAAVQLFSGQADDRVAAALPTARGLATALAAPGAPLAALRARAAALGFELLGAPQVRALRPSKAAAQRAQLAERQRAAARDAEASEAARAAADAAAHARRRADVRASAESAEAEQALACAAQRHSLALKAAEADAARAEARAADDDALRVLEKLKALDVDLTQVLCTQQAAAGPSAKEPGAAASPVQAALGRAASALGAPPKSEG